MQKNREEAQRSETPGLFPYAGEDVDCRYASETKYEIFADASKRKSLSVVEARDLAKRERRDEIIFSEQLSRVIPGDTLGRVVSINTSHRKGERKTPVESGEIEVLEGSGCTGDAHMDPRFHRQVSFLSRESIEKARARGLDVKDGDFAENFTVEGFAPYLIPVGTLLRIGEEVEIEISQIGKLCHKRCAIYYLAGTCVFPREGVFGVVLKGGVVHAGDSVILLEMGNGRCSKMPD